MKRLMLLATVAYGILAAADPAAEKRLIDLAKRPAGASLWKLTDVPDADSNLRREGFGRRRRSRLPRPRVPVRRAVAVKAFVFR